MFRYPLPTKRNGEFFPGSEGQNLMAVVVHVAAPTPDGATIPENYDAQVQEILSRHRSGISNFANQSRLGVSAGNIGFSRRRASFGDATAVYTHNSGIEQLAITVYPVVHRVKEETLETPFNCLMVLYSGNKVAAIPMDALVDFNGQASTIHKATLNESSWGSSRITTAQHKFNRDVGGVLFAPLALFGSALRSTSLYCLSLLKTGLRSAVATQLPAQVVAGFPLVPIMNSPSSGTTIYTALDTYSISTELVITRSGDGGNTLGLGGPYGARWVAPSTISSRGVYTYGYTASVGGYSNMYYNFDTANSHMSLRAYNQIDELVYGANGLLPDHTIYDDITGSVFHETVENGESKLLGAIMVLIYADARIARDMSLPITTSTHVMVGGVDVVDVSSSISSLTQALDYGDFGQYGAHITHNFLNESVDVTSPPFDPPTPSGRGEFRMLITFPYVTRTGDCFVLRRSVLRTDFDAPQLSVPYTAATPYGALDGDVLVSFVEHIDPYATDLHLGVTDFGWMHISNGTHIIQGFATNSKTYIYCNGQEISSKLSALLGVPNTDIQTMIMDMDLKTIKSFT